MFSSFSGQRGRVSRPLGLQLILSPAVAAGAGLGEFGCSPTRLSCPGPGFVRSHAASLLAPLLALSLAPSLAPSQSPEPPRGHRLPPMEWPEAGFLFLVRRQPLPAPPGSSCLRCVSSASCGLPFHRSLAPDQHLRGRCSGDGCPGWAFLLQAPRSIVSRQGRPGVPGKRRSTSVPADALESTRPTQAACRGSLDSAGLTPGRERSWRRLFDNINEPTEV
uniref:Uncharacterized protein n=1 Tax=Myotis myotis TaxID=51298 RepID=A0A7J7U5L5_MYOMY|nr:hypothetical protein mMyoMyo1_008902 [Myotis myotis]